MTTLVARPPLEILSMSVMQTGSRRLSARLQEKDDAHSKSNGMYLGGAMSKETQRTQHTDVTNKRKRRNEYEENDDGFSFSRVKKSKKPRQSQQDVQAHSASTRMTPPDGKTAKTRAMSPVAAQKPVASTQNESQTVESSTKTRRKKMSFSTPNAKEQQPVRRSKRLSHEPAQSKPSLEPTIAHQEVKSKKRSKIATVDHTTTEIEAAESQQRAEDEDTQMRDVQNSTNSDHSATKIALPFADTPVIRRNKAMREGKSMKGDRRSSLGLRGRRASSLIDTGNSNALPHKEVEVSNFYKHIGSDLMEPRRMRQLLTWCATRAMHAKPIGTDFEDASAKSAARIIEEELLKELSSRSELCDWFSREDTSEPPKPLPERPNPKNVQNTQKINELEEQINRLKVERDALQALLKPPQVSKIEDEPNATETIDIDRSLLSSEDAEILDALQSSRLIGSVSQRINDITSRIGPSIDTFADGVHRVAQYRTASDNIASKVLSICAEKFADREKAGRRRALHAEEDRSPGRDLSNVLRGLSRAER